MKVIFWGCGLRRLSAILVLGMTSVACSPGDEKPDLSEQDVNQASALFRSNVLCEMLVKYRVGSLRLMARDGQYHHQLGNIIADAINIKIELFRRDADSAFSSDLNDILGSRHGERYEEVTERLYRDLQGDMRNQYGFSYPDCDMVISMSEAFIQQKGLLN